MKIIIGMKDILILWVWTAFMNLKVVSEKIIKNKPNKNI